MIQHSTDCTKNQNEYFAKISAYEAKYPRYCRDCLGRGVVWSDGDWVDYGSTKVQTPGGWEPCSKCEGVCPRCKHRPWSETGYERLVGLCLPCPNCNWHLMNFEDAAPEQPECLCWIDDIEKELTPPY